MSVVEVKPYGGHCRKSYARKGACATHEDWCHHNPANRACTTCKHFKRTGRGVYKLRS